MPFSLRRNRIQWRHRADVEIFSLYGRRVTSRNTWSIEWNKACRRHTDPRMRSLVRKWCHRVLPPCVAPIEWQRHSPRRNVVRFNPRGKRSRRKSWRLSSCGNNLSPLYGDLFLKTSENARWAPMIHSVVNHFSFYFCQSVSTKQ